MKIVLWILGGVVLLVALVVVVGSALPEGHVASVSAELQAPTEEVWNAITDVRAFPQWRPDVERVEVTSDGGGPLAWTEVGANGRIPFVVERSETGRTLVARIDTESLPFGGSWTYQLEPAGDDRTRLTITENGEVHNPFFRFVSRFVLGHTATIESYLEALEASVRDRRPEG